MDASPERRSEFQTFPSAFNPQYASSTLHRLSKLAKTARVQKDQLQAINRLAKSHPIERQEDVKKIVEDAKREHSRRSKAKRRVNTIFSLRKPDKWLASWSLFGHPKRRKLFRWPFSSGGHKTPFSVRNRRSKGKTNMKLPGIGRKTRVMFNLPRRS